MGITHRAIGLDLSINNVGVADVSVIDGLDGRRIRVNSSVTIQDGNNRSLELHDRLRLIHRALRNHVAILTADGKHRTIGIENFSRGSKFRREEMGAVFAACVCAFSPRHNVVMVTPKTAKAIACPAWSGFNKANWIAAGRTTKFKLSMPEKDDVLNGLTRRFNIRLASEHEADAACVAIAALAKESARVREIVEDVEWRSE